jgi:hypothetical protein
VIRAVQVHAGIQYAEWSSPGLQLEPAFAGSVSVVVFASVLSLPGNECRRDAQPARHGGVRVGDGDITAGDRGGDRGAEHDPAHATTPLRL